MQKKIIIDLEKPTHLVFLFIAVFAAIIAVLSCLGMICTLIVHDKTDVIFGIGSFAFLYLWHLIGRTYLK